MSIFLFTIFAVNVLNSGDSAEVCSQFESDKRLMEYMIETRYEVKNLAKDLRRTEEYLLGVLEWRKKEMRQFEEGMLNITEKVNNLQGTLY
jgi:hypothetical protein